MCERSGVIVGSLSVCLCVSGVVVGSVRVHCLCVWSGSSERKGMFVVVRSVRL